MKALVFAAGLGTRLQPFTFSAPKALVPAGGVPMLERVILKLREAGVHEMVVNVHHFASQIVDFLREKNNFGITIHISDETDCLLETGGGILAARRWLDDDNFIVHNADILTDFPIAEMILAHTDTEAMATLLVTHRSTSRYLLMDSQMRMRGWTDTRSGSVLPEGLDTSGLEAWAFGGVHVLSPSIFEPLSRFSQEKKFSITPFYVSACTDCDIRGFVPSVPYRWYDVGSAATLAAAEKDFFGS